MPTRSRAQLRSRALLLLCVCLALVSSLPASSINAATIQSTIDNTVVEFSRGTFQRTALGSLQNTAAYYHLQPGKEITREEFEALLGRKITPSTQKGFTINSTLGEISIHPVGKQIYDNVLQSAMQSFGVKDTASPGYLLVSSMMQDMPLRNLVMFGEGKVTFEQVEGYLTLLNQ